MSLFEFKNACNEPLEGKYIRLQRLNPEKDYEELYHNSHGTPEKTALWDYLYFDFPYKQPFENAIIFKQFLIDLNNHDQYVSFVVIDKKSNRKIGQTQISNIVPSHKRAMIGGTWFAPEFHGTYTNTEIFLLLMFHVFENFGYRRFELRSNTKNILSVKVTARMGFTEEGVFRQHMIVKGKNRDTKWFSILDYEWKEQINSLFKQLNYTQEDKEIFLNRNKRILSLTTKKDLNKL